MSRTQAIFDYIAKASVGMAAAAGYVAASDQTFGGEHAIAAAVLVIAQAINIGLNAATDGDIDGPLPGA